MRTLLNPEPSPLNPVAKGDYLFTVFNYSKRMYICVLISILILLWLCALRYYTVGRLLILGCLHLFWAGLTCMTAELCGQGWLTAGGDVAYWLALPLIFLAVGAKHRWLTALCASIFSTLSLALALPCLAYWWKVGVLFSPYAAAAVLQTDIREAAEFLSLYASPWQLGSGGFSLVVIFCIFFWAYNQTLAGMAENRSPRKSLACVLMFLTAALLTQTIVGHSFMQAFSERKVLAAFPREAELRQQLLPDSAFTGGFGNVALIIGESATSARYGVYGYGRATTPWLNQALQEGKLFLLQHAYAAGTHTGASLPLMLTERNQYNGQAASSSLTIVEAAQAAGYRVVWLSMQAPEGMAGFIAGQADESHWLGDKSCGYDSQLVEFLQQRTPDNGCKTLYLIQLLGSHARYSARYPETFRLWQDGLSGDYDNTVHYTDHILRQLTAVLMEQHNVGALCYISDHGEDVSRYFHHGMDIFLNHWRTRPEVRDIVRIPAFVMLTDEFKQRNQELLPVLSRNLAGYFTNDLTYNLLLGLMQIQGDRRHYEYDPCSDKYSLTRDGALVAEGRVSVKELEE